MGNQGLRAAHIKKWQQLAKIFALGRHVIEGVQTQLCALLEQCVEPHHMLQLGQLCLPNIECLRQLCQRHGLPILGNARLLGKAQVLNNLGNALAQICQAVADVIGHAAQSAGVRVARQKGNDAGRQLTLSNVVVQGNDPRCDTLKHIPLRLLGLPLRAEQGLAQHRLRVVGLFVVLVAQDLIHHGQHLSGRHAAWAAQQAEHLLFR